MLYDTLLYLYPSRSYPILSCHIKSPLEDDLALRVGATGWKSGVEEGWKEGYREGWKKGGMEEGRDGRREGWKKGGMEEGRDGRREGWAFVGRIGEREWGWGNGNGEWGDVA